ncbi:DUF1538 domain-containing protein [Alkalibacterium olivapovliticus]|uniref:Uncharacterized protein DUF1538 n=1 Tax=Alkalibacterium olivapovliticus TaxID=99907 RepID=A0A2T0VW83_9LACT|nr:DUF1538 domain-containing protein [Alkalibacterium olivapovliticus]PRY76177.1 uncharacterized protein DUF1538 [Alkalibacterium olivapovliticus]
MNIVLEKGLEVIRSVTPIFLFVMAIHFFLVPFDSAILLAFILGTLLIVVGLSLFLTGVDIAITPIGEYLGKGVAKSNKLIILIPVGLLLGFVISVAEPSLLVLGNQISLVTDGAMSSLQLVLVVSIGIAVMVTLGLLRIVYRWTFIKVIGISYLIILLLSLFTTSEFLSIAFDASGATTGVITVPFLLALSMGLSTIEKNSVRSGEDSFGLVAIASAGAIMAVMFADILISTGTLTGDLTISFGFQETLLQSIVDISVQQMGEALLSISPIAIIFLIYHFTLLKLPKRRIRRIIMGIIYVILGLILFLTGVNFGFMNVGSIIGYELTQFDHYNWLYILSFILGVVTILAEPAVNVLATQIERVTSGALKPGFIYTALAIGVGIATLLASLRTTQFGLELWHLLLPGYIIAFGLSYFVPSTIVSMAFDAGGVASGPMTGTFILAFIQGAAQGVTDASVMVDGFGMIALVALMPIITIQVFGLVYTLQKK